MLIKKIIDYAYEKLDIILAPLFTDIISSISIILLTAITWTKNIKKILKNGKENLSIIYGKLKNGII